VLPPDLLARFRQGDDAAFMIIHDRHAAEIRPLVARFFQSPFEREEASQEVWLQAYRMASAYDPARGPLLPWLRTLAANRCREILRAQRRRPQPAAELTDADLVTGETPETRARIDRLRAAVAVFVAALDEQEAAVFRLSLMEELGHDEVAVRLNISPRRCKYLKLKLLARAAAAVGLKEALEEMLES
jgi:RNA polymerase sigma-70 factor (ECF subfamily)